MYYSSFTEISNNASPPPDRISGTIPGFPTIYKHPTHGFIANKSFNTHIAELMGYSILERPSTMEGKNHKSEYIHLSLKSLKRMFNYVPQFMTCFMAPYQLHIQGFIRLSMPGTERTLCHIIYMTNSLAYKCFC